MGNGVYLNGFNDIAAGFQVTAQNVPAAQANMLLARPISAILWIVTVAGTFFIYLIPAVFFIKGLFATTGLGNVFNKNQQFGMNGMNMRGGGSSGGIIGYCRKNMLEFICAFLFALNGASGLLWTEMAWVSTGSAAVVQKIANAGFSTADTPASIKQFKDDVKVYSDEQVAGMYEKTLEKEQSQKQSLTNYVSQNHPDASDMNFVRQKSGYTSTVARLQILSEKLQNDNYGKAAGISDPNFYKRHMQKSKATSNVEAPFNPAFINASTAQAFQVNIESSN